MKNIILIIQIITTILELIARGLSESEAISKTSSIFNVSERYIKKYF